MVESKSLQVLILCWKYCNQIKKWDSLWWRITEYLNLQLELKKSREPGRKIIILPMCHYFLTLGWWLFQKSNWVYTAEHCKMRQVNGNMRVPFLTHFLCRENSTLPFSYLIGYMPLDHLAFCEDTTFNLCSKH